MTKVKCGDLCTLPQNRDAFDQWRLRVKPKQASRLVDFIEAQDIPVVVEASEQKRRLRVVGSLTGCAISPKEIDQIQGHYLRVARTMIASHDLRSGRAIVTAEDLAIFLMLVKHATNDINEDGTMPMARLEKMWLSLIDAGDVSRAHDHGRIAVIRNFVSSLGLLDWEDNTYRAPTYIDGIKVKEGRACKWRASQKLIEILDWERAEAIWDKERERRSRFLTGTVVAFPPQISDSVSETIKTLVQVPESETIRPQETVPVPVIWWNGDEITRFLEPLTLPLAV